MKAALSRNRVLVGDAAQTMRRLPDASVDMVLTSPPYFRLRDYAVQGQLGLEPSIDDWVAELAIVATEVERVLVPTGSFWLNVADSYATHLREGAERKSLLLGPERLALRLTADGWRLRNKIVWQKANPVPSSVRDRLTCTWEALYVFVRQPYYYFDLDAIRVAHTSPPGKRRPIPSARRQRESWLGPNAGSNAWLRALKASGLVGHPLGKNPGDVWRLASSSYRGAHHSTFPTALAERAILAGCPELRCGSCRRPYLRPLLRTSAASAWRGDLTASCSCPPMPERGLVLDPFIGSGTTGLVAEQLRRDWLGIDLNPDYARLARQRIEQAAPLPVAQPPPAA